MIFNTHAVDQGVYKCVAINAIFDVMRQDEKNVNLTVKKGKKQNISFAIFKQFGH